MANTAHPTNGAHFAHLKKMTGYRRLEKDPIIDLFASKFEQSGKSYTYVSNKSGVAVQTLRNWTHGKTRKPQHITVRFAMRALGWHEAWVRK